MRLYFITAGAAGMYCGSCIRENALAAELIRQGHQVLLIPLYTPIRTDERDVSERRVFFGGISVYLEQHVPLLRRTPWLFDRLWDAPGVLRAFSKLAIRTSPNQLGALTVSMLRGQDGPHNKEFRKLLEWLQSQPKPDVVTLHNSMLIRLADPIRKALGCPVCCTLQGEDLFLDRLAEPYRLEALRLIRQSTEAADVFVAVSEYYAGFMSRYLGIPERKMRVVPLGINLEAYPQEPRRVGQPRPLAIGYFARVAPEKGLDRLCEAYRILRFERQLPPSRLEAAGYLGPEYRSYLRRIERQMRDWGLGDEFRYHGELDRAAKLRFLESLDVLSVPTVYPEPKGLYVLEAMACGVPVVQPRHGAFPEIIEKTRGGMLVAPNDAASLAEGIEALWKDAATAGQLGRNGFAGVRAHYTAAHMAAQALEVYARLPRGSSHGAAASRRL